MPKRERTSTAVEARTERRAARRAQLLDAARTAIRREGPGTSMEAIATEAGVTKPIVYKHFGDRLGLTRALAGDFVNELLGELARALHQDAEPRDLLRTTVDAYLAFVERDPQVYRFLVAQVRGGETPGIRTPLSGVTSEIARQVALVMSEQLRRSGLDPDAAEPWAFAIVGMVHLAGDWWITTETMTRERLVDYLVSLLWDGMANARSGPAGLSSD